MHITGDGSDGICFHRGGAVQRLNYRYLNEFAFKYIHVNNIKKHTHTVRTRVPRYSVSIGDDYANNRNRHFLYTFRRSNQQ